MPARTAALALLNAGLNVSSTTAKRTRPTPKVWRWVSTMSAVPGLLAAPGRALPAGELGVVAFCATADNALAPAMLDSQRNSDRRENMIKDRRITAEIEESPTGRVPFGSLYVVATPIGNLSDLSQRAIDTLRAVGLIAAEDTRVSRVLLERSGSLASLVSAHEHNERDAAAQLVARLRAGTDVALISDAGTPAISDPGAGVVAAAHEAGIRVIPIPGPSAPVALLSAAGLTPAPFVFEGFLPTPASARNQRLVRLKQATDLIGAHLLIFEAPHRIAKTLVALTEVFGAAQKLVIGRELTKKFEEIHCCVAGDAPAWLAGREQRRRGEFVIAIAARRPPGEPDPASIDEATRLPDSSGKAALQGPFHSAAATSALLSRLLEDLPLSRAVRLAQELTGQPHRDLYAIALGLKSDRTGE
jgi:16S rRNA (cytidine1402-2'-O)-methyltransferase